MIIWPLIWSCYLTTSQKRENGKCVIACKLSSLRLLLRVSTTEPFIFEFSAAMLRPYQSASQTDYHTYSLFVNAGIYRLFKAPGVSGTFIPFSRSQKIRTPVDRFIPVVPARVWTDLIPPSISSSWIYLVGRWGYGNENVMFGADMSCGKLGLNENHDVWWMLDRRCNKRTDPYDQWQNLPP